MKPLIYLMGPTAVGKTPLAMALASELPVDIISVDSAMVYRGMNIGTAKPDAQSLQQVPHRLIDIRDPAESYSAGQFREDALREIALISQQNRIPLLVGGTMLYFRVLQQGIAPLPPANSQIRAELQAEADVLGWNALHQRLTGIDPKAAARIHSHDAQRIQRALEVYRLTGQCLSTWQEETTHPLAGYQIIPIAFVPPDRQVLHSRIEMRCNAMMAAGFLDEVKQLWQRGDLHADLPALRSVGYRQVWAYLAGQTSYEEMKENILTATRQLAKRQLTWLRSWPEVNWLIDQQKVKNLINSKLS